MNSDSFYEQLNCLYDVKLGILTSVSTWLRLSSIETIRDDEISHVPYRRRLKGKFKDRHSSIAAFL